MKRFYLLLISAISFATIANAQYERPVGSELSVGIEGALPLNGWDVGDGNNTKLTNFGVGATIKYAYNFNPTFAATFQTGYIYFPGKELGGGKINSSQVPIKVGARISSGNFYFEPQLGISSFNAKVVDEAEDGGSFSGSTTAFTYAVGVGVMASQNIDIGLRYEAMSKDGTIGFLGLRIAYTFPFAH